MGDADKTRQQLEQELAASRERVAELEALESQRALAKEDLDKRLRETVLLNRVISAGSSALEPDAVMEILCRELAHALDVPHAACARFESDQEHLVIAAEYRAKGRPSGLGVRIPIAGNPAIQHVLEHRAPLVVPNAQTDPRLAVIREILEFPEAISLLIVPLLIQEEVVGTIHLDALQQREFCREEIDLVQIVAMAAGPVLENARLYERVGNELAERKRAQERLRQYAHDLEAHNEELDAFAHTVAHDLRSPLALVTALSDTLDDVYGSLSDEDMRHYLRILLRNARKMGTIIKELLLLASVRKREEVELEPLDMAKIVAEVLGSLSHLIKQHEAVFVVPETWPLALGYGPWIEEVWINYLSNAITYGGRPPRVELGGSEQSDGMVRFWVRDNGPGLALEKQKRLFTPFERLHQVRVQGHGLGLSIVMRIVEKLGGQVGVDSDGVAGRGSEFYFTLPASVEG